MEWSTWLPVSIPLFAAALAQIVAHALANKRENTKYKKECFQNLYSPLIFLISDYYDDELYKSEIMKSDKITEREFRLLHGRHDPNKIFKEMMETLSHNLKYAEHDLISQFHDTKNFHPREKRGVLIELKFQLCYTFCKNYIKVAKSLNIKSPDIVEDKIFYIHFYQLLTICLVNALEENLMEFSDFVTIIPKKYQKKCFKFLKMIESTNSELYRNLVYWRTFNYLNKICKDISMDDPKKAEYWKYRIELAKSHIIS